MLLLALSYDFTCVVWTCLLVYFVAAVSHVLCFYVSALKLLFYAV